MLGAVKLNGILPWELDADVFYLANNHSALQNLSQMFKDEGKQAIVSFFSSPSFIACIGTSICGSVNIFPEGGYKRWSYYLTVIKRGTIFLH